MASVGSMRKETSMETLKVLKMIFILRKMVLLGKKNLEPLFYVSEYNNNNNNTEKLKANDHLTVSHHLLQTTTAYSYFHTSVHS